MDNDDDRFWKINSHMYLIKSNKGIFYIDENVSQNTYKKIKIIIRDFNDDTYVGFYNITNESYRKIISLIN